METKEAISEGEDKEVGEEDEAEKDEGEESPLE